VLFKLFVTAPKNNVSCHYILVFLFSGLWFFHCHVSSHADMGMGFVLKIGDFNEMPNPPRDFPRCGNWVPGTESSTSSGAAGGAQVGAIVMVLCWFVLRVTNCGV
jgi:hypothetical protein